MNILAFVDGRKYRDSEIYKKVSEKLRKAGFVRTPDQINHRWKTLKKANYRAEKQNGTSIIRRAAVIVVLNLDTGRRSGNDDNCVMMFSVHRWFDPDIQMINNHVYRDNPVSSRT